MSNIGKATEPCISTTNPPSDWHLLDSPLIVDIGDDTNAKSLYLHVQTGCIWLSEKEMWLFDEVVDHVGIYGSKGADGLSAFNVGLV